MYPFTISLRYLCRKRVTLICIAGVAVGVMALTVVLSVMNGFLRDIRGHVRGTLADMVVKSSFGQYELANPEAVCKELLAIEHVEACSPFVDGVAIARFSNRAREFVHFRGVDARRQRRVCSWDGVPGKNRTRRLPGLTMDTVLDDVAPGKPALFGGQELFRAFRKGTQRDVEADPDVNFVELGSPVVIATVSQNLRRGLRMFRLSGLFKTGMYEFDSRYVYISLKEAQDLIDTKGKVSGISLRLDDYANAPLVTAEIERRLGAMYYTLTWEQQRDTFLRAVEVERRVMTIILFFIVLVAGFGIFAILTMVVMEKAKDIGTLKAIGATRSSVMGIFVLLGSIIGVIGAVLGLAAGLTILKTMNRLEDVIYQHTGWKVFPPDIYYLDHIPHRISVQGLALFMGGAVLISFLASLYPAWRAARLDPVQTLRYE